MTIRIRVARKLLAITVVAAALTGCAQVADVPRPHGTLEPSVQPTNSTPAKHRESACTLMTAQERHDLAGTTMDQVMPVNAVIGTNQCQWVHSFRQAETQTVSIEARDAREWAVRAAPGLGDALRNPAVENIEEIRQAVIDIRSGKKALTADRACEIYQLWGTMRGFEKGEEIVYPAGNTQVTGVVSTSCIDGVFTSVTYAESHLYPTPTLADRVVAARKLVEERAVKRFVAGVDQTGTEGPSPSPRPSR